MTLRSFSKRPEDRDPAKSSSEDRALYWRRREMETLSSADRASTAELQNVYLELVIHYRRMAALF